jgi:diadenosine tetraphosphatase ApaH/serine/threonine PP2A family protein phosphatase
VGGAANVTLAVLYDVHGNLPALDAVLEDARLHGAERHLLGGDYALFGPWPAETVARLRELDAAWIRGNGERWTAAPDEAPDDEVVQGAIAAAREALAPDDVDALAELPETLVDGDARFCHGSPVSDVRSFLPTPADDEGELLEGVTEPRLVFGHTHLPFRRISMHGGIELVNPGSVGMPFDRDPRAAYALIHRDRSVEHRRLPYDHEASAATLRDRFDGAWVDTVARRIEQARFDPE